MERKIYYTAFSRWKMLRIDITDIYRNSDEVDYRLELIDEFGKVLRKSDYSLIYREKDGEYLFYILFDLESFVNGVSSARFVQFGKNVFGEERYIYYSFPIEF